MEKLRPREVLNYLKLVHSVCDPAVARRGGDFFTKSHNHLMSKIQNIHNA